MYCVAISPTRLLPYLPIWVTRRVHWFTPAFLVGSAFLIFFSLFSFLVFFVVCFFLFYFICLRSVFYIKCCLCLDSLFLIVPSFFCRLLNPIPEVSPKIKLLQHKIHLYQPIILHFLIYIIHYILYLTGWLTEISTFSKTLLIRMD